MSDLAITLPRSRSFSVLADMSGGTKVRFGDEEILLSPRDTVEFATAMLKAVNVEVKFDQSMFRP